jgi:uncharacterized protein YutE (UPF0331/DUF86 family)
MNTPSSGGGPSRWEAEIGERLADFPWQFRMLQEATDAFGDDFALTGFKRAFETRSDAEGYHRAQLVERAVTRVQGYVADLAIAGVKLAGLEPAGVEGGPAERAFSALAQARVIDPSLAGKLSKAQRARNRIEHGYPELSAGDVHRATTLVLEIAPDFVDRYSSWIASDIDGRK